MESGRIEAAIVRARKSRSNWAIPYPSTSLFHQLGRQGRLNLARCVDMMPSRRLDAETVTD